MGNGFFLNGLVSGIGQGMTLGQRINDITAKSDLSDFQKELVKNIAEDGINADNPAAKQSNTPEPVNVVTMPDGTVKVTDNADDTISTLGGAPGTNATQTSDQNASPGAPTDTVAPDRVQKAWRVKGAGPDAGTSNIYTNEAEAKQAAQELGTTDAAMARRGLPDLSPREQAAAKFAAMQKPEYWAAMAQKAMDLKMPDETVHGYMAKAFDLHSREVDQSVNAANLALQMGDWTGLGTALSHASIPHAGTDVTVEPQADGTLVMSGTDVNGQRKSSKPMTRDQLSAALVAFRASPDMQFKGWTERLHQADILDRSLQLEKMRQEGQDAKEDRRDERLQTRLDAQDAMLDKRLAAMQPRGGTGALTVPQQRTNDAIEAARQRLTGMSAADVLKKTQPTTATGRANPQYDPQLAKTVTLANSRKYGDDPTHDDFAAARAQANVGGQGAGATEQPSSAIGETSTTPAATPNLDRAEIAKRFRSDPAMNGYALGASPVQFKEKSGRAGTGYPVLDSTGKVVGYWNSN